MNTREMGVLGDIADVLDQLSGHAALVREDDWSVRLAAAVKSSGGRGGAVETSGVRDAPLESTSYGSLLSAGQPNFQAFQRRLFLRNVTTVLPTTTYSTPFVRELAPVASEMGVSGVAEAATVGELPDAVSLTPTTVIPGMLATNIAVTDQLWSDSPVFAAYMSQRMPYAVHVREEYACLYGNGEVINAGIVGVANTDGVQTLSVSGTLRDGITKAAAQVASAGAVPDSVFVNASDYLLDYAAAPQFYDQDSLPVNLLPTTVVPSGQVVAGAFGESSVLLDRQEATVELFNQHSDFRARGLQLVQCSERVGWFVRAPWAFTVANFS